MNKNEEVKLKKILSEQKQMIDDLSLAYANSSQSLLNYQAQVELLKNPPEKKYKIEITGGVKSPVTWELDNVTIRAAIELTEIALIKMKSAIRTA